MPSELLTGTAHTLTLRNLQNGLAPGFLATATVTATVYNAATDVAILGQTWPITLDYVLQSQGVYRATLEEDLSPRSRPASR